MLIWYSAENMHERHPDGNTLYCKRKNGSMFELGRVYLAVILPYYYSFNTQGR